MIFSIIFLHFNQLFKKSRPRPASLVFLSEASPAKRIAAKSEEIPTRVQFSAEPETERWWEFLSWSE